MSHSRNIIAVDFDGTLCVNAFPKIGEPRKEVISALKSRISTGARVILWTCRTGDYLHDAVRWCEAQGIFFDAVNDNLPDAVAEFSEPPRKILASEYWDDKAVRV